MPVVESSVGIDAGDKLVWKNTACLIVIIRFGVMSQGRNTCPCSQCHCAVGRIGQTNIQGRMYSGLQYVCYITVFLAD